MGLGHTFIETVKKLVGDGYWISIKRINLYDNNRMDEFKYDKLIIK